MMMTITYECNDAMAVGGRATRQAVTDACSIGEAKELFLSHSRAKETKAVVTHVMRHPLDQVVFI